MSKKASAEKNMEEMIDNGLVDVETDSELAPTQEESLFDNTPEAIAEREKSEGKLIKQYNAVVEDCEQASELTHNSAWGRFVEKLRGEIAKESGELKTEDKTRLMIHHQEAVRIYEAIPEWIREPVDVLEKLVSQAPAHIAARMLVRASWDSSTCTVQLRTIQWPKNSKLPSINRRQYNHFQREPRTPRS